MLFLDAQVSGRISQFARYLISQVVLLLCVVAVILLVVLVTDHMYAIGPAQGPLVCWFLHNQKHRPSASQHMCSLQGEVRESKFDFSFDAASGLVILLLLLPVLMMML